MTGDDDNKNRKSLHGDRLLEALRYELAKQELVDDEPTPEELRDVEAAARYWQTRASERMAPTTPDGSREELLARVQEVGEIARAWRGRRQRRPVLPRAERALGEREMRAELARGDAVLAVHAIERADELVLHGAATHGHRAQREQSGGECEQRAEHRSTVVVRRGRPALAPRRGLDEIEEHVAQLRLEAAKTSSRPPLRER